VLIAPYYGHGSGESCCSPELPLPTVTTKARFGLVVPVTRSNGGARAPRSIDDPLPTLTMAKGGEFAVVIPVTHAGGGNRARTVDDPLPTLTGAHRGELACIPAFARTAAFGERQGQAPRVHSIDEPTPTICATGRIQLAIAEPVIEGRQYDIRFRMLEPKELARAMGFTDAETAHEFAGNKTEITKQIGNAVPVNLAAALVGALMQS
jgi:DNA (cytosine-5)-methyltransferase 1